MERKWYKLVNGAWVEAPEKIEFENSIMFNYNDDSNEYMLRNDGYLPENEIDVVANEPQPTLEERVADIEQVTEEVITILNDKGIVS